MRIFSIYRDVVNIDNNVEATRLLAEGARELTQDEICTAGMAGYEHLVSPLNTVVSEDGSIIFTPPPSPNLHKTKIDANARIDAATSRAITAGFDYELTPPGGDAPETLHFSYDAFDQQNFADSANVAALALSGVSGLPASVTWNAYRDRNAENGGELVRLSLGPADFLALYTAGALAHKAARMEEGGARKAAVDAAQSIEDVLALLARWGL